MNLEKIKEILDYQIPNDHKESLILSTIADDPKAIPTILEILQIERDRNKELLLDTNLELSRAVIVLNDENLKWTKKIIAEPSWIVEQIKKHYKKWKGYIRPCFPINGVENEEKENVE